MRCTEFTFHKDDFICDMHCPKHCSLKYMHRRRASFQCPPSHTDPTDPLLAFCFSSPFQNGRRNQNLVHLAWKMTEFYQISDVKKRRQLLVLWKMSTERQKNEVLAFRDWEFSKLLSVQFYFAFYLCLFVLIRHRLPVSCSWSWMASHCLN